MSILTGGTYESPDALDNLPAIIEWTRDCLEDPWMPRMLTDDVQRMLREATELLEKVRAG